MTAVPELPVVRVPRLEDDASPESSSPGASDRSWAPVDVPPGRRVSPTVLGTVAVLAGVGAMALGAIAVVAAGHASRDASQSTGRPAIDGDPVGQRALALLAKPSTERIAFQESGGRLVLGVGSGGRAAILLRGFEHAPEGRPFYAWAIEPGGASPVRAARFTGTERIVFLSVRLGPRASVVVSRDPSPGRLTRSGIVARRG